MKISRKHWLVRFAFWPSVDGIPKKKISICRLFWQFWAAVIAIPMFTAFLIIGGIPFLMVSAGIWVWDKVKSKQESPTVALVKEWAKARKNKYCPIIQLED